MAPFRSTGLCSVRGAPMPLKRRGGPGVVEHLVAIRYDSNEDSLVEDFPSAPLKPYNLAAQHPDDFIVDLLDLHPAGVLEAVARHRRSLKNPPKTADEYLDTLLAQGLTQSVAVMRQWVVAI